MKNVYGHPHYNYLAIVAIIFSTCLITCAPKHATTSNPTTISNEKTIAGAEINQATLLNTYWHLEELNTVKISNPGVQDMYIKITTGMYRGFAGCNEIWGICKVLDNQLRFTNSNRTKMSCENIEKENLFIIALDKADSYLINENILTLLAKDGSVVAKFSGLNK